MSEYDPPREGPSSARRSGVGGGGGDRHYHRQHHQEQHQRNWHLSDQQQGAGRGARGEFYQSRGRGDGGGGRHDDEDHDTFDHRRGHSRLQEQGFSPRESDGGQHYSRRRDDRSHSRSRSRSRSRSPPGDMTSRRASSAASVAMYGRRPEEGDTVSNDGTGSTNDRPSKRDRLEADRRARMARLRAENEEEERRIAALENTDNDGTSSEFQGGGSGNKGPSPQEGIVEVKESDLEGLDEENQMRMMLGFSGGFGSTKGTKVESNHSTLARGAAAKNKARKYRQYMNRKNGFNRPLDKMD